MLGSADAGVSDATTGGEKPAFVTAGSAGEAASADAGTVVPATLADGFGFPTITTMELPG